VEYLDKKNSPLISIGMPVHNGAETIRLALDSLLNQTFYDFDIIISDNASTDETEEICKTYASKDSRIIYIRQSKNMGAINNFKNVFVASSGEYFTWAGADDIHSFNYLEVNYNFLEKNLDYVASGSPNRFSNWKNDRKFVDFSLDNKDIISRYLNFFQNCYQSHGLFYCLFRSKILKDSELFDAIFPGHDWLAFDWAFILYLLSKGKIKRVLNGEIIFGVYGISNDSNIFRVYNNSIIEYFIPFYKLSKFVMQLTEELSLANRVKILFIQVKLNIFAHISTLYQRVRYFFYKMYCRFLKPIINLNRLQ